MKPKLDPVERATLTQNVVGFFEQVERALDNGRQGFCSFRWLDQEPQRLFLSLRPSRCRQADAVKQMPSCGQSFEVPYDNVDAMWSDFEQQQEERTPAINDPTYYCVVSQPS